MEPWKLVSLPDLGMPEPKGEYDLGATYPAGGLMSERYPIDMASREEKAAAVLTRVAAMKSFMFNLVFIIVCGCGWLWSPRNATARIMSNE
jgi:hypothetical protein